MPFVDEWLAATIRRSAVRTLAHRRQVDLDDAAVSAIADGPYAPPSWKRVLGSAVVGMVVRRAVRKAFLVFLIGQRAREITRTFAVLTLFDHYCARVHVGAGLSAQAGRALREHIDQAVAATRLGLFSRLVELTLKGAPMRLYQVLSKGALARILATSDEAVAAEILDETMARGEGGLFAKMARVLESHVTRAGHSYVSELVLAFREAHGS
jgi:hypothetical protein